MRERSLGLSAFAGCLTFFMTVNSSNAAPIGIPIFLIWCAACGLMLQPYFNKQHGHRCGQGSKDEPRRAKQHKASDNRNEGGNGMQPQTFADEYRPQYIVDAAHHNCAPD